jgi:AraC-like DNA-binding protein
MIDNPFLTANDGLDGQAIIDDRNDCHMLFCDSAATAAAALRQPRSFHYDAGASLRGQQDMNMAGDQNVGMTGHGRVEEGYIRIAPFAHLDEVLAGFKLQARPLLESMGLSGEILSDPENTIPYVKAGELLERCASATACPHFGLRLGLSARRNALGLVGEILPHCADLGTALGCLRAYYHLHDRGAMPTLVVEGDTITLAYSILVGPIRGFDQVQDMALAVGFNIIRALCGRDWKPRAVLFSRRGPDDMRPYQKAFPYPMAFDAECTSLVLPKSDLERRVAGADAQEFAKLEARLAGLRHEHGLTFLDEVRRTVQALVVRQHFSVDAVARSFAMNRRQLNRRLENEGTSIREIADEVRRRLALCMIDETDMSLGDVSAALGYSGTSTFNHAFRRWQGVGPKQWRRTATG